MIHQPHRYWKWIITANNGGGSFSAKEIEYRATYDGADQTAPGGAITGSPNATGGWVVGNLVDNNTSTEYNVNIGDFSVWVIYDFVTPVYVQEFAVTNGWTASVAPKDFTISFSDDGVIWYLKQSITGETGWAIGEQRVFDVETNYDRPPTYVGYTNHDKDLVVDGVTYAASTGYTPTDVSGSAALNVDNLDLIGLLISSGIDESSIEGGALDGAEVRMFMVDWENPANGTIELLDGVIGEVTRHDEMFVAEVRSKAQHVQQHVVELTSNHCRAQLGDSRCGVPLRPQPWKKNIAVTAEDTSDAKIGTVVRPTTENGWHYKCVVAGTTNDTEGEPTWSTSLGGATVETDGVEWETIYARSRNATVTAVTGGQEKIKFAASALAEPDDWWNLGRVIWLTGNNVRGIMEVKNFVSSGGDIELYLPMYNNIQIGDTFFIEVGCNKEMASSCVSKFSNGNNFRGEPFIPGRDTLITGKVDGQYTTRAGSSGGSWLTGIGF
jgi:uncharacterized phage protein (TIGR02218 family)